MLAEVPLAVLSLAVGNYCKMIEMIDKL